MKLKKTKIYKELTNAGWTAKRSKHMKMLCPCGQHIILLPLSPSDNRWEKNETARAKRTNCKSLENANL